MSSFHRTRPGAGLALAAVLGLGTSFGLIAAPAGAEPGNGNGHGNGPVATAPAQPQTSAPAPAPSGNSGNSNPGKGNPGKGNPGNSNPGNSNPGNSNPGNSNPGNSNPGGGHGNNNPGGHGNSNPGGQGNNGGVTPAPAPAPGSSNGDGGGNGGGNGDPAGNNGTIKIAGPGDLAGHPSNNPHPGCTFLVEWYGFDAGTDVVSTVSFASHAPTSDVVLGGTAPSTVFVGEDAAGGGTDLDGRQAYTLTFDGEPHPQQGYHVKLTVSTPRSHGNDTKSKVFWVAGCETPLTPTTPTTPGTPETPVVPGGENPETPVVPEVPAVPAVPGTTTPDTDVLGEEASEEGTTTENVVAAEQTPTVDVLGEQASVATTVLANSGPGTPGSSAGEILPSVINAGVAGKEAVAGMSTTQSALALLMLLLAGASARLAYLRRKAA